jgi:hypothetical protein
MLEFIVVAEAPADALLACGLADRIFLEEGPDWLDENVLPHCRTWSGFEPGTSLTRWTEVRALSLKHRLPRYRGHINGKPQKTDYALSRKAALLFARVRETRPLAAMVLVRDLDSQPERRDGLRQARGEADGSVMIVLATPDPKREAWVLNGFICVEKLEEDLLEAVRQELNFDPCHEAHRLRYASRTSRPERDPKRILARLTSDSHERERRCWTETPLALLRERGKDTLLEEYLDEVKKWLLPLLT